MRHPGVRRHARVAARRAGTSPLTEDPAEWFRHLIMPAVVRGGRVGRGPHPLRAVERASRRSGQDYTRTAGPRACPARLVLRRHVLRNALVPVVTVDRHPARLPAVGRRRRRGRLRVERASASSRCRRSRPATTRCCRARCCCSPSSSWWSTWWSTCSTPRSTRGSPVTQSRRARSPRRRDAVAEHARSSSREPAGRRRPGRAGAVRARRGLRRHARAVRAQRDRVADRLAAAELRPPRSAPTSSAATCSRRVLIGAEPSLRVGVVAVASPLCRG